MNGWEERPQAQPRQDWDEKLPRQARVLRAMQTQSGCMSLATRLSDGQRIVESTRPRWQEPWPAATPGRRDAVSYRIKNAQCVKEPVWIKNSRFTADAGRSARTLRSLGSSIPADSHCPRESREYRRSGRRCHPWRRATTPSSSRACRRSPRLPPPRCGCPQSESQEQSLE